MTFSKFTDLCNHHHNPIMEQLHHPKRPIVSTGRHSPSPLIEPGKHQSSFEFCRFDFLEFFFLINRSIYKAFSAWLLSFNILFLRFYLCCIMYQQFIPFFIAEYNQWYGYTSFCLSIHQSIWYRKILTINTISFKDLKPFRLYISSCVCISLQIHDSISEDDVLEEELQSQLL